MPKGKYIKQRFRILVKAYPEASKKHEETVCCAGVTEDGAKLVRLYPIRFRRLPKEHQFYRYDLVEMEVERNTSDSRPESHNVSEDSIRLISSGRSLSPESKARLWLPFVEESLPVLEQKRISTGQSLGIIKAPTDSLEFYWKNATREERNDNQEMRHQMALFEDPLRKLEDRDYIFRYRFTSGGQEYTRKITDWEVYATWYFYKRRYGDDALEYMKQTYQNKLPSENLHFILGNVMAHPHRFLIIGLLRSSLDLEMVSAQQHMF